MRNRDFETLTESIMQAGSIRRTTKGVNMASDGQGMNDVPEKRYYYKDRMCCTVLDEMRLCLKTFNFAPMTGLIEELQILANRMEASLDMSKQYRELQAEVGKLKDYRDKLHAEITKEKEAYDAKQR